MVFSIFYRSLRASRGASSVEACLLCALIFPAVVYSVGPLAGSIQSPFAAILAEEGGGSTSTLGSSDSHIEAAGSGGFQAPFCDEGPIREDDPSCVEELQPYKMKTPPN